MTGKKLMLSLALAAGLIGYALASASAQSPSTTALETVSDAADAAPAVGGEFTPDGHPSTAPSFCKPCLYYSGDFDPANEQSNGQFNGNNLGALAYIYTPVSIPTGRTWKVTGLIGNFINLNSGGGIVDPATAGWSIWQGVAAGVPGTLIASGVAPVTVTPTGRMLNAFVEYNVVAKFKPAIKLPAGTYFVNLLPQCTNPANVKCSSNTFQISVADASPPHQFGSPNLLNASFFYSAALSVNYAKAVIGLYSFGVIGTSSGH